MVNKRQTAGVALTLALGMASSRADATGFSQTMCGGSGYWFNVPASFGAKEYDLRAQSPAGGVTDGVNYNVDTTSRTSYLRTNGNVDKLRPWYSYFNTEATYDRFLVYAGASYATTYTYTGAINTGASLVMSTDQWTTNQGSSTYGLLKWNWISDPTVTAGPPPSFGQLDVQCKTSQSSTAVNSYTMSPNYREEGILLATSDTLYYTVAQPAGVPMVMVLERQTC